MTDTTRESLKWFLQRLEPRAPSAAYGVLRTEAHATIIALLTRAEAAEAERDEAMNQLDSARHEVDCLKRRCEQWNAERDALQAKLALAVEVGTKALNNIDDLNTLPPDENGHRWAQSDLIDQEVMFARIALAQLTADTPKEGK